MKNVFVACLLLGSVFCIISCDKNNYVQNRDSLIDKEMAAIEFISILITIEMHVISMGESIDEECVTTNPGLEDSIREFSQIYEGGTDRTAIARTLDLLMWALFKICDNDEDNALSYEESSQMMSYSAHSNGIGILVCLSDAYRDTPRK